MSCECPHGGKFGHDLDCSEYESTTKIRTHPKLLIEACLLCGCSAVNVKKECLCHCHSKA